VRSRGGRADHRLRGRWHQPLGQRKRLPTVVDETVHLFDTVLVSGGRRGLDLELRTADLIAMLDAAVADIAA
jgi:Cys-tRNA(Pro)/Cys-tRNA(Cys) deacylase